MPLTVKQIEALKPLSKIKRYFDGHGLYLEVTPAGNRWWRYKYRYENREKRISLGVFPDIGLKQARERRDQARRLIADGIDPGVERKARKQARVEALSNSFELVAREWFQKFSRTWAPKHAIKIIGRLEKNIFPWLGNKPIADIRAPDVLNCLRRIEERGKIETAHRTLQDVNRVFNYGVQTSRVAFNPCIALRGAIPPAKETHRAAFVTPAEVAGLLNAIDGYRGHEVTRVALQLAPLVFVRPGELRQAEWAEIDLEKGEWNIPAEKMKMREPHLVPLATQAIELLKTLMPLTGGGRFVFPSARTSSRPMSDNAVLAALRRMGFTKDEVSGHGFRATARTLMEEVLHEKPELIRHQMSHAVQDPMGRAYDRTSYLAERKLMMQRWADYLDHLKRGAEIIPIKKTFPS